MTFLPFHRQSFRASLGSIVHRKRHARRLAEMPRFGPDNGGEPYPVGRGGERLTNPVRIHLALDEEATRALRTLWKRHVEKHGLQPYLLSRVVREAIRSQREIRFIPPRTPRVNIGVDLAFACDPETYAVIRRQMQRTGSTRAAAVRDILVNAALNLTRPRPVLVRNRRSFP